MSKKNNLQFFLLFFFPNLIDLRDSLGFKPESASSLTFDDCLTGLEGIKRNLLNTKEQVLIDLQKLVSNKDNGDLILDAALV